MSFQIAKVSNVIADLNKGSKSEVEGLEDRKKRAQHSLASYQSRGWDTVQYRLSIHGVIRRVFKTTIWDVFFTAESHHSAPGLCDRLASKIECVIHPKNSLCSCIVSTSPSVVSSIEATNSGERECLSNYQFIR